MFVSSLHHLGRRPQILFPMTQRPDYRLSSTVYKSFEHVELLPTCHLLGNASETQAANRFMYHEYELDNGIKVQDATEGRVKAEFMEFKPYTRDRVYKILIEGHEVFAPTYAFPLAFCGSDSLIFEEEDGYIHIKELDKGQELSLYVNVQKVKNVIKGKSLLFSCWKPCQLTEEQLRQRLDVYKEKYLKMAKDIQIVAHNAHGVVVVGWDKQSDGPFYGNKQMPFVAISHADDEKWCFYPGRDFGRYGVRNEADGRVKITCFGCRFGELEIHRYIDEDTGVEKIAINSEEAMELSPDWMVGN
jgi:hypothetical protein